MLIDTSRYRGGTIVVEVEVQLTVASSELELLEEEWVVVGRECVEDVKVRLGLIC